MDPLWTVAIAGFFVLVTAWWMRVALRVYRLLDRFYEDPHRFYERPPNGTWLLLWWSLGLVALAFLPLELPFPLRMIPFIAGAAGLSFLRYLPVPSRTRAFKEILRNPREYGPVYRTSRGEQRAIAFFVLGLIGLGVAGLLGVVLVAALTDLM